MTRDDWMRALAEHVERMREVNLHGVPTSRRSSEAAFLLPASVTADLNFPACNYDGRGPLAATPTIQDAATARSGAATLAT